MGKQREAQTAPATREGVALWLRRCRRMPLPKLGRFLHCRRPEELARLRSLLEDMAQEGLVEERRGKWSWRTPEAEISGVFVPRKERYDTVMLDANEYGIASVSLSAGVRRNFPGDRVLVRFPLENRPSGGFDPDIARQVTENGHSVVYAIAGKLFADFETVKFERADPELLQDYYKCDLLIIDDLGTEMTTQFVTAALYEIVNSRLLEQKSTIISTNLNENDLESRYGGQIASRLVGSFRVIYFLGDDIRRYKKRL